MSRSIVGLLKVTTLALVLSFGLSYVYAWTAPTATPPGGNVSAPLNTSATTQTKAGGLNVTGNVGVGTMGPGYKLHIQAVNPVLMVDNTAGGGGQNPSILRLYNNNLALQTEAGAVQFTPVGGGTSILSSIGGGWSDSTSHGFLGFHTSNDGGATNPERVRIDSAGNVGIGTTAPAQKLDVVGNIQNTGSLTTTGDIQGRHIKFPGVGGDSGTGADYYGIYQESGPWSYPYPDLRIQYHTGIKYDAYRGYGGHQFYTGYDGTGNPTGLQMQITDKVYVSNDVCTTAGKCLSTAAGGGSSTYHDVTGSRSHGVNYTNSTGKDMVVYVTEQWSPYVGAHPWIPGLPPCSYAYAYVSGVLVSQVSGCGDGSATYFNSTLTFNVPSGAYYQISGTAWKQSWMEYY